MAKFPHKAEREQWILDWFMTPGNFAASAVDEPFHEAYHKAFPMYQRKEKVWGAQPVAQAQKDLARMADCGILDTGRVGLGANWQPGFPRSVIGYTLNDFYREQLQKRTASKNERL